MVLRMEKVLAGSFVSLVIFSIFNLLFDIRALPPMMGGICVIGILAPGFMAGLKFQ